jgi:hypothetical protein
MRGNRSTVSACDTSQTGSCQAGAATRPGLAQTAQQLLIVWLYFLLGQACQSAIHSVDTLPFLTARLLRLNQVGAPNPGRPEGARIPAGRAGPVRHLPDRPAGRHRRASGMKSARYFPADGLAFAAAAGLVVGGRRWPGPGATRIRAVADGHRHGRADRAVRPAEVVCPARAETALLADPG